MKPITESIARRCLEVVDQGLSSGLGVRKPGEMCVEAAICFALDLPHGDDPGCVSPAVRALKIQLNDSAWSSPQARAKGLRRLALAQLGSRDVLDDQDFAKRVVTYVIRDRVPFALRAAASIHPNEDHRVALMRVAAACAEAPTAENASAARSAASEAARSAERDRALSDFAEGIIQILIEMNAPGCKWLFLTEAVEAGKGKGE